MRVRSFGQPNPLLAAQQLAVLQQFGLVSLRALATDGFLQGEVRAVEIVAAQVRHQIGRFVSAKAVAR